MLAAIFPAALLASWKDYREHRVPNWLNAAIALTGLATQATFGGWAGLENGLKGMLLAFGMLILFWAIKGMGAGDVKFMAAIGTWLGPDMTVSAVMVGAVLGGLIAVGMIIRRRKWRQTLANFGILAAKVSNPKMAFGEFGSARSLSGQSALLPYAIPLSLGSLIVAVTVYSGWWEGL
ncbi:MAG TPA: A24 family peptidase [Phycisphaerae bacterium]|nr:A24 family peptidase [Phycisphaerae bacterium]